MNGDDSARARRDAPFQFGGVQIVSCGMNVREDRLRADVADYVRDLPFTGYAANTDWARTHKELLSGFLVATASGVDWFYKDENRAGAIDILVKESRSSRQDVEMTYDYYRALRIFDRRGLIEASSIGNLIKAMKDIGDLDGSLDVARFIDPDLTSLATQVK